MLRVGSSRLRSGRGARALISGGGLKGSLQRPADWAAAVRRHADRAAIPSGTLPHNDPQRHVIATGDTTVFRTVGVPIIGR